jgi:ribosomal-protein-alanine N-acetyltransferase
MLPFSESSVPVRVCSAELEIRRMRGSDLVGVMEIESVSFGSHHWVEESFYNEMNNQVGRYYVLLHNPETPDTASEKEAGTAATTPGPRLIGYCGFWLIVDEAHVTTVAVHPEYRGNALGELLLVHMTERCLGSSVHWMTLEVRSGNYSAQNLYYKYGFQSMGMRPKYYQNNAEDALIMTTPDISGESYRALFHSLKETLGKRLGGLPKGLGD